MYTWDMKTEFPWEKAVLMDKIEAAIAHFYSIPYTDVHLADLVFAILLFC